MHTRGDLLQRAVPLRLFERCEQLLLRVDHIGECRVLCLKFLRNGIKLRDTACRQLPAIQSTGQMRALHEPRIPLCKAEEKGIPACVLLRDGGRVKCRECCPELLRAAVLPPEEPLHELQHGDVDKCGGVPRTSEENSLGQEIQPRTDGGNRHIMRAACPHGEQHEPYAEQREDEDGTQREEGIHRRQCAQPRKREQKPGEQPALAGGGESNGERKQPRRITLRRKPAVRRQLHEKELPAAAEQQNHKEADGECRRLGQQVEDPAARETCGGITEHGTLGDEDETREEDERDNLPIAVCGQAFYGAAPRSLASFAAALPSRSSAPAAMGNTVSIRA